jgi:hypothetical protein
MRPLIAAARWTSQPASPAQIDPYWLSRGLSSAVMMVGGAAYDFAADDFPTVSGTLPSVTVGRGGLGWAFNGTTQSIFLPATRFKLTAPLTRIALIQPTAISGSQNISSTNQSSGASGFQFRLNGANLSGVFGGVSEFFSVAHGIAARQLAGVGMVLTGASARGFVGGRLIGTAAFSSTFNASPQQSALGQRGNGAEWFGGNIYLHLDFNRALADGEAAALTQNPWLVFQPLQRIWALAAGSGAPYTLTAEAGSFALTGQAVALTAARKITAEAGSFALAGQAVNLRAARVITAGAGTFALTGQDVALIYTPAGAYTLAAGAGNFALTGQDVNLRAARKITAEAGSFALTGQAVNLLYTPAGSYTLTADAGQFVLTGQNVTLRYSGAAELGFDPHYLIKLPAGGSIVARPRDNWTIQS